VTLTLLRSDPRFVVIDKPSGLSVHRGLDDSRDNVVTRAHAQLGAWVWPVHRLDRATSGCLLLALDEDAARTLSVAFAEHRVEKVYLALVRGSPPPSFEVDHPLPRSEGDEVRVPAQTAFRTLGGSENGRYALVEARPATGRLHQIRRHLRHVRHPILGDTTWGDNKLNKVVRAAGLMRMALHASRLAFSHPSGGADVVTEAPLPVDFAAALGALGIVRSPIDAPAAQP
jgi:tRNA pseudouridine65 synthase